MKLDTNIRTKVRGILQEHNIPYTTEGKNVTEGTIAEIKCPYCNDPSQHCGIAELDEIEVFSCWRCRESGSLFKLFKELFNISWDDFKAVFDILILPEDDIRKRINDILYKEKKEKPRHKRITNLPRQAVPLTMKNPLVKYYLTVRNFDINILLNKFNIKFCRYGDYVHRLIIPVYEDKILRGFIARDMTNKSNKKYLIEPEFPISGYLYNIDRINSNTEKLYIVEGVTDVWRLYKLPVVAVFGMNISSKQTDKILDLNLKEIIIALDTNDIGKRMADKFIPFIEKIKVLELPEKKDPDKLGMKKLLEIEKKIEYL